MNLSALNFIENRHLVHQWFSRIGIVAGLIIICTAGTPTPVWKGVLGIVLIMFGVLNGVLYDMVKPKPPQPNRTEQHRERVLNALDGLKDAQEALDAVNYDHPNVIRARLHVAKAMKCLERRQQRLQREGRPKKPQAASADGGSL